MLEAEEKSILRWEDYTEMIRRRRWWVLVPAFLIWFITWAVVYIMPAKYKSEATILIVQQAVPEQYVTPNVNSDLQSRVQSMTQQVLSRPRLQNIIDTMHLYPQQRATASTDELVDDMRKDIEVEVITPTLPNGAPAKRYEPTAFKIKYTSSKPKIAQQVTGQLTSLFIEENLRSQQQQSESTTDFLQSQLEDARRDLEAQENKVREFKAQNAGTLPEQMQSNLQILGGLQGRLQSENDALNRAQQQKEYLESLAAQYKSAQQDVADGKPVASPAALDKELEKEKSQLAELSSKYTDKHPDIVRLKQQIAATEKLRQSMKTELASAPKSTNSSAPDPGIHPTSMQELQEMSPYLQVQSQIRANQLEIQNRQKAIDQLEAQIQSYQGRLNMIPVREGQLAVLSRGAEQSQKNYDSLLSKLQESQLASNMEKRQQGEQFRIIDPPNLPQSPDWPNRLLVSLAAVAIGLIVGIVTAIASELLDDRIHSENMIKSMFPGKVLVGIPVLCTPHENQATRRRAWIEVGYAATMLVVVIVGNLVAFYG